MRESLREGILSQPEENFYPSVGIFHQSTSLSSYFRVCGETFDHLNMNVTFMHELLRHMNAWWIPKTGSEVRRRAFKCVKMFEEETLVAISCLLQKPAVTAEADFSQPPYIRQELRRNGTSRLSTQKKELHCTGINKFSRTFSPLRCAKIIMLC